MAKKRSQQKEIITLNENFDFKTDRLPPQAIDVEQRVLGAILIDNLAYLQSKDILKPEYFYVSKHGIIYSAITNLEAKNEPIDCVSVKLELERMGSLNEVGNSDYLIDLTGMVSSSANIEYYSRIIYEKYVLRQLIHISSSIVDKAFDSSMNPFQLIGEAENKLLDVSNALSKKQAVKLSSEISNVVEEIGELIHKKGTITGVQTGYHKLDDLTSGLQKSELIIIAGRPSHGKTAFAMNIARNAAIDSGKSVGIFSLEMSTRELIIRLLSKEARVDGKKLKAGRCSTEEWSRIQTTFHRLKVNLFIDDSSELTIHELRAKAKRMYNDYKIDLLVVDYLQLVRGSGSAERRDLEVAEVSRGLKALAKDLNIPVLACAQLNRGIEARGKEKRPQLADLMESGALEQDADVVIFVHRQVMNMKRDPNNPEYEDLKRRADIIIGKQRNGPIDDLELKFISEFASFENPETHPRLDMELIDAQVDKVHDEEPF